jgi:hypothetical protein
MRRRRREISPNTVPRRVFGSITARRVVELTPAPRGLVVGANPTASSDVNVPPCLKNPSLGQLSRQSRLLNLVCDLIAAWLALVIVLASSSLASAAGAADGLPGEPLLEQLPTSCPGNVTRASLP